MLNTFTYLKMAINKHSCTQKNANRKKKVKKLNRKNKLNTKIFGNKGPRAGGGNTLRGQLDSWSPPGRMLC